jgi:Carboxypeptidase regulatory-like domain
VDAQSFRAAMSTAFRAHTVTGLETPEAEVQIAADGRRVTFLEVESIESPAALVRQTRLFRTTLALARNEVQGRVTLRIEAVQRVGPVVTITTPGQVQAGVLTRVTVTATTELFTPAGVEVLEPETGVVQTLRGLGTGWYGAFLAPRRQPPPPLQIQLRGTGGEALTVLHRYRLRMPGEGVVQPIGETEATRLRAVTVAPDGTVWAGGDNGASLYRVPPGATTAQFINQLLPKDPTGRVEDLVLDDLRRLHAVVFAPRASGVIVMDQGVFCQTVNVVDKAYPFRDAAGDTSLSTRAVAAEDGAIWLIGSDAGIARVTDAFRAGQCPKTGLKVHYEPVLRREDGVLPANTVPALVVGTDGALWVGSALGLSRLQNGQETRLPFDPALSFQGHVATLEEFFREVARAIFEARPLTTVALERVSFVEAFGSPLVKADLVFSLAQDVDGHVWVGTLGGGLRRIDTGGGVPQEALHLTRQEGMASNIIFALAVGPDGMLWAASDEGVSRLEEDADGTRRLTTFGALDGLGLPARDVAVDAAGVAWVATDGGLFRITPQGGQVVGVVHDTAGQPVDGADVLVLDTPLRAVTDADGRFALMNLPPGPHLLRIDGRLAAHGPFTPAWRELVVTSDPQTMEPVVLRRQVPGVPVDPDQEDRVEFPTVPGAALDFTPGTVQFPAGVPAELGLTLLPLAAVPRSLPQGFTAVATAEFQPDGITFTTPARGRRPPRCVWYGCRGTTSVLSRAMSSRSPWWCALKTSLAIQSRVRSSPPRSNRAQAPSCPRRPLSQMRMGWPALGCR